MDRPSSSTASSRVPYRAESTPPRMPLRLHSPSPLRYHVPLPPSDYPESPTRGPRRLPSPLDIKPIPFQLNAPPKSTWKGPRMLKSGRRTLTLLGFLALLALLVRFTIPRNRPSRGGFRVGNLKARWVRDEPDEGICRFASPVEAYQRDLQRLRRDHSSTPISYPTPQNLSHPHHNHIYSPTGHLLFSPDSDAPHPIPLLLALGEKRWEELLSRQSRTLTEAVREYNRRYGRRPPKGFDVWWQFTMEKNLVLPDEYDRINLDLAPFFALPKEEMNRRMEMVEHMAETFTLIVKDGIVDIQVG